jgi:hypothetical protein
MCVENIRAEFLQLFKIAIGPKQDRPAIPQIISRIEIVFGNIAGALLDKFINHMPSSILIIQHGRTNSAIAGSILRRTGSNIMKSKRVNFLELLCNNPFHRLHCCLEHSVVAFMNSKLLKMPRSRNGSEPGS